MRKNIIYLSIFFLMSLCASFQAFASDVFVPSGLEIDVLCAQEINLDTAVVGQKVEAILLKDYFYNDKLVIPKDSVFQGSIVSYSRISTQEQQPFVQIVFSTIRTPYNNIIPINASIKTNDLTGILRAEDKELLLMPNEQLTIIFNQPITLNTH